MGRGVPSLSIRAHGSSGEGSAAQAVAMPRRFFSALPAGLRPIALRARAGAALVFFWADAQ